MPGAVYLFKSAAVTFARALDSLIATAVEKHEIPPEFNVVKFRTDEPKLSFLTYREFENKGHPALRRSVTIDLVAGGARHADYSSNLNPPMLHRKEQMLPFDHPRRVEFLALPEAEEAEGLYADTATIGFKSNWERLLTSKGLNVEGYTLRRLERDLTCEAHSKCRAKKQFLINSIALT